MSGFYSPWSGGGDAGAQIGASLQKLTSTMAQKQMLQRYQQQQLALRQQDIMNRNQLLQAQVGQQHAAAMNQSAQAGFNTSRQQHQQGVDEAARQYQTSVVAQNDGPEFMQNGPTIDDANRMAMSRELGARALVRALGGNIDNPPTATINPGQERINTLTGDLMGYLPPSPTFHAAPAGSQPYVLDQGVASPTGQQTPFKPAVRAQMNPHDIQAAITSLGGIAGNRYASSNTVNMAESVLPMLVHAFTNQMNGMQGQLPARTTDTTPNTQRVRVKGPNGETGTVDASEQLPDGWTPIQ